MQHEIVEAIPLLDEKGNLTQPGYAKKLLPVYERRAVKAGAYRLKEWDYYYVGNDRFGAAMTIADNGYMGLDSISFLSFQGTPWQITKSPMRAFPMGGTALPATSAEGTSAISGKGYALVFIADGTRRVLPAHFYYNQKINCMRARGAVKIGAEEYTFDPSDSFGVLDWGRGVWTYHNTWYWGSASGLVNGEPFGFNIGYGFGDTSAATENMLFYKGKAHKLSEVTFNIPMNGKKEDYLKPWTFTSDDGRFEMDFMPVIDRASNTDFKVLKSDQHQVFGRFTGTAVLDDGTKIQIKDFMGFAEKVENKW